MEEQAKTGAQVLEAKVCLNAEDFVPLTEEQADALSAPEAAERMHAIGTHCKLMVEKARGVVLRFLPEIRSMRRRYSQPGRRKPIPGLPTWKEVTTTYFPFSDSHMRRLLAEPTGRANHGCEAPTATAAEAKEARRAGKAKRSERPSWKSVASGWRAVFKSGHNRANRYATVLGQIGDEHLEDILAAAIARATLLGEGKLFERAAEKAKRLVKRLAKGGYSYQPARFLAATATEVAVGLGAKVSTKTATQANHTDESAETVSVGVEKSCDERRASHVGLVCGEGKRILTKEFWEPFTPEEQKAHRQRLFIERQKKADPWMFEDEGLEGNRLEDYLNELLGYCRVVGLPHYRLTTEEKKKELKSLLKFPYSNLYRDGVVHPSMHALGLAWSYFPHSWGIRCNKMLTPEEVINDDTLFKKAIKRRMKQVNRISDVEIRKAMRCFSGAQAVSNFRPTAAAAIYHHFLPKEGGVTWDMSSGFGGRLLGAMACDRVRKYIGTDPSTLTMKGLREMKGELLPMLGELWPERPKLEIELRERGSEKFTPDPETVDLCFTSPPYFNCEEYADEATQSYIKFPTKDRWMHGFVKQTLANCWRALRPDGHLVINIAGVKTYPELVTDFKQLAENNGWENVGEAGLKLFRMMGTRKRKDGYEVMKTEPLLIFRKTIVNHELRDFVPAAFVPTPFAPVEHGTLLAA
jgi:hypothetical protein